jgi:pilus assembly protein FimV
MRTSKNTTVSQILPFGLKTLSAAVACAVLVSSAHAAALGRLTVLSSLGQPLRAEIEVTAVEAGEAGSLVAKLASADAYRQANVEFNPALSSLRFAVESRNGRQIVAITSAQPVNEPFVDMLLELQSSTGKLVREYTFLLDPAELRAAQTAQVVAATESPAAAALTPKPAPAPTPAPAPVADLSPRRGNTPPAPAPTPAPAPVAARAGKSARPAGPQSGAADYTVRPGDSLGAVANQVRPNEVSLDQMLVALYRANPDAFIGNNMNRLKSGQILKVPDEANVRSVGEREARGIVLAQSGDFNSYRSKLAGQVQQAAPEKAPEARQSGSGKIAAKVEEKPTAANTAEDKLKLSRTLDAGKADKGGAGKAAPAVEDKVAQAKAASEAGDRVKELERNVNELERLMALKNKTLAGQGAKTTTTTSAAVTSTTTTAAVAAAGVTAAAAKPKRSTVTPPPSGPSMVDSIMADPKMPLLGAGLVAALLALLGLSAYRKRKAQAAPEAAIFAEPAAETNSLFAATGGQSVDTSNSVFNSNFAPSASQLDTNEVDPVAEADVYIAYGRDVQAEEILKEALRTQPDRAAVRLKLLEIYANRKDTRLFEAQARELFTLTGGDGDDWTQAAALGLTIDPNNPLYASAQQRAPAMDAAAPVMAATAAETFANAAERRAEDEMQDLDLDLTQAPAAGTGMDFALDEEPAPADAKPDAAQPEAAQAEAAQPDAAQPEDDNVLDFDLGGLSFDTPPAKPAAPAAAPAPTGSMDGLDDFDIEPVAAAPAPAPAPAPEAPLIPDLSFDLDLPATPAAAPAPAAEPVADLPDLDIPETAAAPAPAAKEDEFDLGAMDFDIPPVEAAAPAPAPADALPDLDIGALDMPAPGSAPAPAAAAQEFDISDIDLDLAPAGGQSEEELSPAHVEMDTKLDLALAYQEIGDKEGARELIDEVLAGGSPSQIEKAQAMRAKLG